MKKVILVSILSVFGTISYAQMDISEVQIEGQKKNVLTAKSVEMYQTGKLSSGEVIKSGCDHGACYIKIEYKGREITKNIGDAISNLAVYEYDFGNDGNKEIIVVNEFAETAILYVFSYKQGLIQKLFEKEVMSYKTIIKKNYIEYYMPSGLDQVWNYYQGQFWDMTPIQLSDY